MNPCMFRLWCEDDKIVWCVIQLVSICMMYDLPWLKRSSNYHLGYLPMQMASEILSIGFSFSGTWQKRASLYARLENTTHMIHGIVCFVVDCATPRIPQIRVSPTAKHVITNLWFFPQKRIPAPIAFDQDFQFCSPPVLVQTTGRQIHMPAAHGRTD